MISGDYEIKKNNLDDITYTERTMVIELTIVTDETGNTDSRKFLEELQSLLHKYAI